MRVLTVDARTDRGDDVTQLCLACGPVSDVTLWAAVRGLPFRSLRSSQRGLLDTTMDEGIRKMRGVRPEPIREHLEEISGIEFPPKQVLEHVSGFDRRSYTTTMEANRIFKRLGFTLRRAGDAPMTQEGPAQSPPPNIEHRLSAVKSALAVAQEAIAGAPEPRGQP
jgi:hypothetical protein